MSDRDTPAEESSPLAPESPASPLHRRDFLKLAGEALLLSGAAAATADAQAPSRAQDAGRRTQGAAPRATRRTRLPTKPAPDIVVIGAGAFGGWTAYHLRRMGAKVTLVDAFGPGNSRSTS